MDTNSLVIVTGLISALLAWSAVQDAGQPSAPAFMEWKLSRSWTTSAAAIAALAGLQFFDADDTVILFGLMLLIAPLLYRGFAGESGASPNLFFAVATLMAWSTLVLLTRVSQLMFFITRNELAILPRLVLNGAIVAALLAAAMSIHRALSDAASGNKLTAEGAWTLP